MEAAVAPPRWRTLPAGVSAEVDRRRTDLLSRLGRSVLDLDRPDARELLQAGLDGVLEGSTPRFAAIVSTCGMIVEPDLARAVGVLARLLADDGELVMVEPVNRAGALGLLVSSAGAWSPAVAGLHVARDVVAAVRAAGLTVADLYRFEIDTPAWSLRRFVQLRAVRIPRP